MLDVKIKLLIDGAKIPTKGTNESAGYDLYAPQDFDVKKGRQVMPLGFAMEIPKQYYAIIKPRSGNSLKGIEGVTMSLLNGKEFKERCDADVYDGIIDSDYRKVVGILLHSNVEFTIKKGMRIAQMLFQRYEDVHFVECDSLSETNRDGGFGSTGV